VAGIASGWAGWQLVESSLSCVSALMATVGIGFDPGSTFCHHRTATTTCQQAPVTVFSLQTQFSYFTVSINQSTDIYRAPSRCKALWENKRDVKIASCLCQSSHCYCWAASASHQTSKGEYASVPHSRVPKGSTGRQKGKSEKRFNKEKFPGGFHKGSSTLWGSL
jgi:hypothetical protein